MRFTVYLSPLAALKIEQLVHYLELEWGLKAKESFLVRLKNAEDQISIAPQSCEKSPDFNGLHKCTVSKRTSFYYRILEEAKEIEIITLIDNRQDPRKVAKEIKKYFG